ncbi:MAG TPA: metal-dependent transcriptional regulator [Actinomycetota bacterium]|nr:metal-dependent transcriptional regulator [Actinomycetota bacterium]
MSTRTSPAAQDYLKAIFMLGGAERPDASGDDASASTTVSTKAIAERMVVSAASATNMLKKLAAMGLVRHVPYRGASLTEAGRKVALEVIRHHRLLETYLAEALGMPWDRVHAEAEVLEHVLSEELEDRIASLLGHPTADPHGHPIPSKDLRLPASDARALWEVADGDKVSVDRVSDAVAEALRYLAEVGIRPGVAVEVVRRGPVNGPLFVRIEGGTEGIQALSRELAEAVWVA